MYSPEGRTGRRPGSAKLIVAAVSIALMGMAGAALAAPKADPGPPEQAQANGPPPQAQVNGPPPHAQDPPPAPAPASARARANGRQSAGKPAAVAPAPPSQAGGESGSGSGAGPGLRVGAGHGRPSPAEIRGRGQGHSNAARAKGCQAARCRGTTPEPVAGASDGGGDEQPKPSRGKPRADERDVVSRSEERPDRGHGGVAPDLGSVQGLNQGGDEEAYAARGSFDGALPFTGLELALLAAIGALLGLAGVWVRRSIA
jgi:hypothetical protein